MAFELYVIQGANQMNQLLIKTELTLQRQGEQIVEASVIGCRTLRQLVEDSDFRRTLGKMVDPRLGRDWSMTNEFKGILDNVDKFEYFLRLEHEVLVKGGIAVDLADRLVNQCRVELNLVRNSAQTSDEIFESV